MPDLFMDVDAAVTVPMNIYPLTDDTDFKTIETGLVYDSTGIVVNWNFVTTAGAMTTTAITPTTGGAYDIAEPTADKGLYTIEIPASGGASANNATEGFGWITGVATGILPWRGPTIGFRAAGLNNILIDSAYSATRGLGGTALPDAAADAAGGLIISDAGAFDIDAVATDTDVAAAVRDIAIAEAAADSVGAAIASILTDTGTTLNDLIVLLSKWALDMLVRTDNEDGTITYVLYDTDDTTPLKTWVYTTATETRAQAT